MHMRKALIAIMLATFWSNAHAERMRIGWMNIQPCSTVEWRNDGLFGLPSPTVRTAAQEAALFLDIDATDFQQVQSELSSCAQEGVAAATLAALLTDLPGAAPAFWTAFGSCASNINYFDASLSVETACQW